MQLQVEVYDSGIREVYWIKTDCIAGCTHNNCAAFTPLQQGRKIVLAEEPEMHWTVLRTFIGLSDESVLPPKAEKRTFLRLLEEDGSPDLHKAFPQIF